MRTELWNGYSIRFVEKDGEWLAVAKDVADALGYSETNAMARRIGIENLMSDKMTDINGRPHEVVLLTEYGIYDAVFGSHKPEAKEFKKWVYMVLKELRKSTGLEGFQIFRMLDKEHQKEAMEKLNHSLRNPEKVDFIKANTIANKAVSIKHGFKKMIKKSDMTPEMLSEREPILDDTVQLMSANDKFGLGLSVSEKIYEKVQ